MQQDRAIAAVPERQFEPSVTADVDGRTAGGGYRSKSSSR
jgi:hypothetical protein